METPLNPPAEEPRWPQVVGTISVVYAIIGLLCQSLFLVQTLASDWIMRKFVGNVDLPKMPASMFLPQVVAVIFGTVLGIILLMGGLSVLKRRAKGVKLVRLWAVLRLVLLVFGIGLAIFTAPASIAYQREVQEKVMEAQQERSGGRAPAMPQMDEKTQMKLAMVMIAVISAIQAVYPVFAGVFLSRASVAEEVARWETGDFGDDAA